MFRLGKFREMKGPGLFLIVPLIDQMRMVDAREAGDDHEGRGGPRGGAQPGGLRHITGLDLS
ncbi:MAG TPA: hypothetical protein VKP69_09080 [Isosphaeraceae bacterium]|nr:hypothetical protein [Isosphaeraceae bacterium]